MFVSKHSQSKRRLKKTKTMDLSLHRINTEAFEYRHKKFDHVRGSPDSLHSQPVAAAIPCEDERSMAGTPYSFISNSTFRNGIKRELDDNDASWEPSTDDIEPPCTPTKRQRMLTSRSSRNKRTSTYELCSAPVKCKAALYDARSVTPESVSKTPNLLPKISPEALERIYQYNKNMVRKFPKKERTVKDQERRDKNTIACRMSRRYKKLENFAVEEEYKIYTQEYFEQSKQAMYAAVYLNELLKFGIKLQPNKQNEEIIEPIARKLNLHHLEKLSTKGTGIDYTVNDEARKLPERETEKHQPKNDEQKTQQKSTFSIAYLIGEK